MNKKLYVGNLSYGVTEGQLEDLFGEAGSVVSASIITDRATGRSKGFGFVEMETDEAAQTAIDRFNNYEFEGRSLTVNEARPRQDRPGGGGGGGRRGGPGGGGGNRRGGPGGGRGPRDGGGDRRRSY
jgi:RNA recognition motif-containing protein